MDIFFAAMTVILAKSQPLLVALGLSAALPAVQLTALTAIAFSAIIVLSFTIYLGISLHKGYKIKKEAQAQVEAQAQAAQAEAQAKAAADLAAVPLAKVAAAIEEQQALVRAAGDKQVDPQLLAEANEKLALADQAAARAQAPKAVATLNASEAKLKAVKAKVKALETKLPQEKCTKAQINLEKAKAQLELLRCRRDVLGDKYEASQAVVIATSLEHDEKAQVLINAKVKFVEDKAQWDAFENEYPTLFNKAKEAVNKAQRAVQGERTVKKPKHR